MTPSTPRNYFPNASVFHAEQFSKFFIITQSIRVKLSYFKNFLVSEFYRCAIFTFPIRGASLSVHICNIFKSCAKPEMIWIAAISLIRARMKYPFISWYCLTIFNHPCDTVRFEAMFYTIASDPNLAVTARSACGPNPAFIRPFNGYMGEKSVLEMLRQYLIKDGLGYNLCSHIKFILSAALSGEPTPRGQFHFNKTA